MSTILPPSFVSRLRASCCFCGHADSRTYFYKILAGQCPGFTDVCPRPGCGSQNVEVSDPVAVEMSNRPLSFERHHVKG